MITEPVISSSTPFLRVLCIDGGGLRGIVSLRILQKLEEMTERQTYELFDVIDGTGMGGNIGCSPWHCEDGYQLSKRTL